MIEEFLEEVSPHFIRLDYVMVYDTIMKYAGKGISWDELTDAWNCLWSAFPQESIAENDSRYLDLHEEMKELIFEPEDSPDSIFHPDYQRMQTYTLEGETDGTVPGEIEKELKDCRVETRDGRNHFTATFNYDSFAIEGMPAWIESLFCNEGAAYYRFSIKRSDDSSLVAAVNS